MALNKFQVKESDLLEALQPAGFVWELSIPQTSEGAMPCIMPPSANGVLHSCVKVPLQQSSERAS